MKKRCETLSVRSSPTISRFRILRVLMGKNGCAQVPGGVRGSDMSEAFRVSHQEADRGLGAKKWSKRAEALELETVWTRGLRENELLAPFQ